MKISIRNYSNKKRSVKLKNELKIFTEKIAKELDIYSKIKEIKLFYVTNSHNYYPKDKPFGGFNFLFSKGIVNICFYKTWDKSQQCRKNVIIHELTHVKQLINKELEVSKNGKFVKWNNQIFDRWNLYDEQTYENCSIDSEIFETYKCFVMPWEVEIPYNIKKLNKI